AAPGASMRGIALRVRSRWSTGSAVVVAWPRPTGTALAHTGRSLDSALVLPGELPARLLPDEVVLLALPLEGCPRREVREADVGHRVLHHEFLRVEFILGHRQVGPHEIDDAVIDPPRGGYLIDRPEGEFQLRVWLVAEVDRDDLQVVAQDHLADVAVCRGGELEADPAQARLELEGPL